MGLCIRITSTLSSFRQFQRMVKHITGRSAFFSNYRYGCYCGLGDRGIPVGTTDRWRRECEKAKGCGCEEEWVCVEGQLRPVCALLQGEPNIYEKAFEQVFLSRPHCGRHKLRC
ncbi:Pla2g2c [Phodopus roborovskii]|uniref:Pla2g2c protein n=1 Tax=Phodopus roborovskii TaxID=109678 RepID=A0AAV0ACL2_PHORO|nr:Pla2g2c [Phodopus roborovskii]